MAGAHFSKNGNSRPVYATARFAFVLFLLLCALGETVLHNYVVAQGVLTPGVDYVQGEVIVTFTPGCLPSPQTLSPPVFGIAELDAAIDEFDGIELVPAAPPSMSESGDFATRMYLLRYGSGTDAQAVVGELDELGCVEYVGLNEIVPLQYYSTKRLEPDELTTEFERQWYADTLVTDDRLDIDAPEAWAIQPGAEGIVIGVLDTGTMVDTSDTYGWRLHSDFNFWRVASEDHASPGILNGADIGCTHNFDDDNSDGIRDNIIGHNYTDPFACVTDDELLTCPECENPSDATKASFWQGIPHNWILEWGGGPGPNVPLSWNLEANEPYNTHGVRVASLAAGKAEGNNIVGVGFGASIYVLREHYGELFTETQMVLHASTICDVINMSWGTGLRDMVPLRQAVQSAARVNDCVLVAASGNGLDTLECVGTDSGVDYPGRYTDVLSVGAMTKAGCLTKYSRWTSIAEHVGVVAPVDYGIWCNSHSLCYPQPCSLDEKLQLGTGTSFAAPQVAGLAALVRARFPGLNQADIRQRVKSSAEFYWDKNNATDRRKYGSGKINAYRTLSEWGSLLTSTTWTTNALPPMQQAGQWVSRPGSRDGEYYISGDLTIEPNVTLTIEAGTIVNIAPDHERKGADLDRVQIVVKGTLNVNGTAENPVVFVSFTDGAPANDDWVGIKFEAGSSGTLSYVEFRNAERAIVNYAPLTGASSITNCTFTNCGTAIEARADLDATGTLIVGNSKAVDIHAGDVTLTKCTIADNTTSAAITRTGTTLEVSKCVTASNGGPAVHALSGGTGLASMDSSVVFQNGSASGSRTDADWQTQGQIVHNINPAFCNAGTGDYRLYAFSPASAPAAPYTGYFGERVGARDVGCVPGATVTTVSTQPVSGKPGLVIACPKGDKAGVEITVDLDGLVTRDITPAEIVLDNADYAQGTSVFDTTAYVEATASAVSPYYTALISHQHFGGHGLNDVDILLNGHKLSSLALLAKATFELRTMDISGDGIVNVTDYATFGAHYTSPPKAYNARCDYELPEGTITLTDFTTFAAHYNHQIPVDYYPLSEEENQSTAGVTLAFTEEFSASTHRLYVDVGAEDFSGVTASVFSMQAGSSRLALVAWIPAETTIGNVVFAPVVRDGSDELFFGVNVAEPFSGTTAPLGRLVFDVSGIEPFGFTPDHFMLTIGDVLLETSNQDLVVATMGAEFTRTFDPAVVRIYHNSLEQNFPNPFNPTTTLAFSIKDAGNVSLVIYDVAGRRVRELVNERRERGTYRVDWDGRNDAGQIVASGVYLYKLKVGSFTDTKKMTLLK